MRQYDIRIRAILSYTHGTLNLVTSLRYHSLYGRAGAASRVNAGRTVCSVHHQAASKRPGRAMEQHTGWHDTMTAALTAQDSL